MPDSITSAFRVVTPLVALLFWTTQTTELQARPTASDLECTGYVDIDDIDPSVLDSVPNLVSTVIVSPGATAQDSGAALLAALAAIASSNPAASTDTRTS